MLTPKENFYETIKKDGKPDRLVNQYEDMVLIPATPTSTYVRGKRFPGMEPTKDLFGTVVIWPENQPAAMPHVTDETKVVKVFEDWQDYVKFPDLVGQTSDPSLWTEVRETAERIHDEGKMSMVLFPTGVFEQMHFLTGFADLFVGLASEEEAALAFAQAVGEWRYDYAKLIIDNLKPDIILSHDDWGTKDNLFISPQMWRTFIKPAYEKTYRYIKESGTTLIHHADSYLEPIVEDMVELGIDVWQGVLPSNDVPAIQEQLQGRMALMGGLDAGIIDREISTEEEIRQEVRRACSEYGPAGHFMPCITYGAPGAFFDHVDPLINDEINRYNKETYGVSTVEPL